MIEMLLSNVIYFSSGYIWSIIDLTLLTITSNINWFLVFLSCSSVILPFGNLTDKEFSYSVLNHYTEISNRNSSVLLKPPSNLALLFNQFNNSFPEQEIHPENVVNSRYFDIDQIQSLKFPQKEKSLSFFHINASSWDKNLMI